MTPSRRIVTTLCPDRSIAAEERRREGSCADVVARFVLGVPCRGGAGGGIPARQFQPGDPEVAAGSYFLGWLLEHRRRAEAALITVVATSSPFGVSARQMENLVEALGIVRASKV